MNALFHASSRRIVPRTGFTLIELLIVVAIIAILAAIAVPNFLEAQTRAKVSRSRADMRSLVTAIETYRVDYGAQPVPFTNFNNSTEWWGFTPFVITTPIAYMTSLPIMPFQDTTRIGSYYALWTGNSKALAPYTYIYDTAKMDSVNHFELATYNNPSWNGQTLADWVSGGRYHPNQNLDFAEKMRASSYVLYTSGPDNVDGTVYWAPTTYDPTNGTLSYGDIHAFGAGTSGDSATGGGTRNN